MEISNGTFASVLTTVSLVSVMLTLVVSLVVKDLRKRGKVRVFLIDPDAYSIKETWQKLAGNEFTLGKGDKAKTYILDAAARLSSPSTWLVHERHGTNYRALSDAESVQEDALLNRLAVSNPAAYHMAIARNRQRDALNANAKDDKWGWVMPVVVGGVVCVLAVLCVVIWIAFKISNATGKAPGA
jgi:hypothetical protein